MDDVDRMYRHLVRTIRATSPQLLTQPFQVGDIYTTILPYRLHRRDLGVETNQDYEMALLELLSGSRGYLAVDDRMREELGMALRATSPDPSVIRNFATARVALAPDALERLEGRPTGEPAGAVGAPGALEQQAAQGQREQRDQRDQREQRDSRDLRDPREQPPQREQRAEAAPQASAAPEPGASAPTLVPGAPLTIPIAHIREPDAAPPRATATSGTRAPASSPSGAGNASATGSATAPRASSAMASASSASAGARRVPKPITVSPTGEQCRHCRGELPAGREIVFCPHCGQDLTVQHCPACGTELELGWKFCVTCGRAAPAI